VDGGFDAGMDADMALDGADAVDHPSGLQLLSIRTVTAFMTGFGWAGAFSLKQGLSLPVAVLIAVVVGVLLTWLVFLMMKMLYSLRESGSLDYRNAVGQTGSVYIPIPPGREGDGQVQVLVQGRFCTVPACTDASAKIPSGRQVRVLDLVPPRTLVVEPLEEGAQAPQREEA
jgi:membrane protein implicated in regulation of membrane protease activity